MFGVRTRESVVAYQRSKGLTADGLVGTNTWNSLMADVVGRGASSTTILPS